jgi:hypothetical protein
MARVFTPAERRRCNAAGDERRHSKATLSFVSPRVLWPIRTVYAASASRGHHLSPPRWSCHAGRSIAVAGFTLKSGVPDPRERRSGSTSFQKPNNTALVCCRRSGVATPQHSRRTEGAAHDTFRLYLRAGAAQSGTGDGMFVSVPSRPSWFKHPRSRRAADLPDARSLTDDPMCAAETSPDGTRGAKRLPGAIYLISRVPAAR